MGKYRTSVFLAGAFAVMIVTFQNCASDMHQPSFLHPSSLQDCEIESDCRGGVGGSEQQLFLRAQGEQYIVVEKKTSGSTYIEVGGDCFSGGFPENEVVYRITEYIDNGRSIEESTFDRGDIGSCRSGRFGGFLRLPSDYQFNLSYTLELELLAYDNKGNVYSSPSGRHRLELVPQ